jgi:D-alanyl-D-alanine carboxypeptidase (penicillin-binding protein 5/6)
MQQTADRLGAFDTVVGTPSGLDVAGQSSSPYDLALIFRQLVADPATAAVLMTTTADMPAVGDKPAFQIQNQDPLLGTYPGNLGAKSGFTDAARHTFVTAAERDGRRIVVSLMQTERRPVPEAQQAALLLDWGFSVPAGATGVGRLVEPGEVPATPPPAPSTTATTSSRPAAAPAARSASTTHAAPGWLAAGAVVLLVAVLGVVLSLRRRNRPGSAPPPG